MSVNSFKKEVWESALITEFEGISLVSAVTTAPTSVEGKTAHFNVLGEVAVNDYEGTVDWAELDTTNIDLVYDNNKYFACKLKDVDKAQLAGDVMSGATRSAVYKIQKGIDTTVFAEMAKSTKNVIGSASTKKQITTCDEAYDYIVDLGTLLDKNDVPANDRFVIASPEFVNLLAKDKRVIDNAVVLPNGIVQGMDINGMSIAKSNNVPANTVLAIYKGSTGFGKQIDEMEAMRLQDDFADGVRGLVVYGTVNLRENAIAKLVYEITE